MSIRHGGRGRPASTLPSRTHLNDDGRTRTLASLHAAGYIRGPRRCTQGDAPRFPDVLPRSPDALVTSRPLTALPLESTSQTPTCFERDRPCSLDELRSTWRSILCAPDADLTKTAPETLQGRQGRRLSGVGSVSRSSTAASRGRVAMSCSFMAHGRLLNCLQAIKRARNSRRGGRGGRKSKIVHVGFAKLQGAAACTTLSLVHLRSGLVYTKAREGRMHPRENCESSNFWPTRSLYHILHGRRDPSA